MGGGASNSVKQLGGVGADAFGEGDLVDGHYRYLEKWSSGASGTTAGAGMVDLFALKGVALRVAALFFAAVQSDGAIGKSGGVYGVLR